MTLNQGKENLLKSIKKPNRKKRMEMMKRMMMMRRSLLLPQL
jgi:hypothetical protein